MEKDEDGNLKFYFTDSAYDIEFFDSEIENLDYKEGNFYQIEGSKYHLGSELTGISVDKVFQTIEDKYTNSPTIGEVVSNCESGVVIPSPMYA